MNERSARALLGVSPSATTGQIKRAYRRAALELHPDRGGDPAAFQQLVEAQQVLLAGSAAPEQSTRAQWVVAEQHRTTTTRRRASRRPPVQTRAVPSRPFGDVLAEKLAAA